MLSENPFFVLDVTVRHDRRQIVEQAETRGLANAQDRCREARAILTTPRRRVGAELAWLPGVAPARARSLAHQAVAGDKALLTVLDSIPPLAACNLVGTLLVRGNDQVAEMDLQTGISLLASRYELIEPESVRRTLNEDRAVSGFPEIPDESVISEELHARGEALLRAMADALGKATRPELFLTALVELLTDSGSTPAPRLLERLVAQYQLQVQDALDKLATHIEARVERLSTTLKTAAPDAARTEASITEIEELATEWDRIAQPVQLIAHSQGIEDSISRRLALSIRQLSLDLWNEHDLRAESRRLTVLLSSLFKELPELAERVANDLGTIDQLLAEQAKRDAQSHAERQAWEREIALDLPIGSQTLKITGRSISYNGKSFPLDSVTAVRWGVFKHYVNGIRVNREYTIWIGKPDDSIAIECVRTFESEEVVEKRYELILERLWKAVCRRLLVETLTALSTGRELSYGSAIRVNRAGIVLPRSKYFFSSEPIHYKWEELSCSSAQGSLTIQSRLENASVKLSYRDVWNLHILEAMLRFLWKDGNHLRLARGEFS